VDNMKRKSSRHKQLIAGITLITLALIICLSIVSYNTTDYDGGSGFKDEIENLMGRSGAIVSHYLINFTFGYPVLIASFLLFLWGWQVIRQKPISWIRTVTAYSIYTMALISYGLAIIGEFSIGGSRSGYEYSGIIGGFFASYSAMYLGKAGTIIIFCALTVILVVLWSNIRFLETVMLTEKAIKKLWRLRKNLIKTISGKINDLRSKRKRAQSLKKAERLKKRKERTETAPPPKTRPVKSPETEEIFTSRPLETVKKDRPFIPISERIAQQKESIKINPLKTEDISEVLKDSIKPAKEGKYTLPSLDLLEDPPPEVIGSSRDDILRQAEILETTLLDFGVKAKVSEVHPGPVITLYEVLPDTGVKVHKILSLQDDLARTMQAKGIRIIAPIPGKDTVGIEIPNHNPNTVFLKTLLADQDFRDSKSKLSIALGKTISGETYIANLGGMPHLLIAGATGSGKSVCIATLITSILYKAAPSDVQFIMIDPKMLELSIFKKLKLHHLLTADFLDETVVTKPQNAVLVLRSVVAEMEKRYEIMARTGVRNIDDYNSKRNKPVNPDTNEPYPEKLEYIVVIIDELADLMIVASKDVEEPIARLAQMARAVGIHLVVATQRPSVDVITGVIKANFPARIAFQVAQKVDSRTILDMNGAEQLLGRGDMLFLPPGSPKPIRLQNAFITTKELEKIIYSIEEQPKFVKTTKLVQETSGKNSRGDNGIGTDGGRDPLFTDAARLVVIHQQGSISLIQRRLKVGYSRAARLVDELEDAGIVGPYDGSKARQVLIEDEDDLESIL